MHELTLKVPDDSKALALQLRQALRSGIVTFTYKKKTTGQLRVARGTTNKAVHGYTFRNSKPLEIPGQINYWDTDKAKWRSVKENNIIKIIDNV